MYEPRDLGWFGIPFDGWVAIGTWLLFLATAGLFFFTYKLWRATRTLIGDERYNSSRELRAYVLTKSSDIRISPPAPPMPGMLAVGFEPYALIEFKNFGKTPAYDFRSIGNIVITPWPIDENALPTIVEGVPGSVDFLGPDDSRTPEFRAHPAIRLTEWDMLFLEEGTLSIVVYGKVRYRDAFGVKWTTNFRKFAGGPVGLRPTSNLAGNLLTGHAKGNEEAKDEW